MERAASALCVVQAQCGQVHCAFALRPAECVAVVNLRDWLSMVV